MSDSGRHLTGFHYLKQVISMAVEHVFNQYYIFGKTDCGKCRVHNEDTILINSNSGIVLLADGMGGHQNGDKASFEAIRLINQLIEQYLSPIQNKQIQPGFWKKLSGLLNRSGNAQQNQAVETCAQIISDILIETNRIIYGYNQDARLVDGNGMGTTVVGCKFSDASAKMHFFHLGDSRLYRLRNNKLTQITKDHSAYQAWMDNGQVGEKPRLNIIHQGIGPRPEIKPDVAIMNIEASDCFMLCSDGLTDMVEDSVIAEIIENCCKETIEEKTQQLIDIANDKGGDDNISVILICQ